MGLDCLLEPADRLVSTAPDPSYAGRVAAETSDAVPTLSGRPRAPEQDITEQLSVVAGMLGLRGLNWLLGASSASARGTSQVAGSMRLARSRRPARGRREGDREV